jgi:hypothetical protein
MKLRFGTIIVMAALGAGISCKSSGGGGAQGATTEECSDACAKVAAADCGDIGAECVDSCLRHPIGAVPAACTTELAAFLDCFWVAEAYFCDDLGTQAVGCDNQHQAVLSCIENPGGGEGGAGGAGGVGGAGGDVGGGSVSGAAGAEGGSE